LWFRFVTFRFSGVPRLTVRMSVAQAQRLREAAGEYGRGPAAAPERVTFCGGWGAGQLNASTDPSETSSSIFMLLDLAHSLSGAASRALWTLAMVVVSGWSGISRCG